MSCSFKVQGEHFSVDAYLAHSSFNPCGVWHKGDRPRLKTHPAIQYSGFSVILSEWKFNDLAGQIRDALLFLQNNGNEIAELTHEQGVDELWLNFTISERDVAVQCEYFPPELIREAARFGMGLEVSIFPPLDDENSDGKE